MSLYKQFGTNHTSERDGVWFPYPQPDGSLIENLIARTGGENSAYRRGLQRIMRKFSKGGLSVPIEQYPPALKHVCELMAETVWLGWRWTPPPGKGGEKAEPVNKMPGPDGKLMSYSQAVAEEALRTIPDLRLDIQRKAADFKNFQDIDPEAVEGN